MDNIYNNVVNQEIMTDFKVRGGFRGSNALWVYVVVNASWKSYTIHHDQSGFSRPNHKRKRGENKQYSQCSK